MEFIIHPYEGVEIPGKGMIRFGMTREEVRSFFDEESQEVIVSETSKIPTDKFQNGSIRIQYKEPGIFKAIAFIQKYQDTIFQDKCLSCIPYVELKTWFKEIDPDVEIEMYEGLTSYKFGISFWTPNEEQLAYIPETVFVFEKGYWNK